MTSLIDCQKDVVSESSGRARALTNRRVPFMGRVGATGAMNERESDRSPVCQHQTAPFHGYKLMAKAGFQLPTL